MVCVDGEIRYVTAPRAVADAARDLSSLREVRALVARAVQGRHCTVSMLARELGPERVRPGRVLSAGRPGRVPEPVPSGRVF